MNIGYYLKRAASMPIKELIKKILNRINLKVKNIIQKAKDSNGNTNINFDISLIKDTYIDINKLNTSNIDQKVAKYLSEMYCKHRFDLLGSGWVENSYDSVALGVEGYKYEMNMLSPKYQTHEYEPIDWQKDFKSGYRWSENTWYKDIVFGKDLGVDIKVPWELARFQHLPQLAIFAIIDKSLLEKNIKEFKYQVIDFISNNPPRMGVNWVCTMDVGIRVSNMLIAYDIFVQMDKQGVIDTPFKQIFSNSIYEHGLHIINNLEWSQFGRNNHYLSDIAGLLYVSAYLESTNETTQWLAFSIQELINEMEYEFNRDGGNFESSTSYHRLSGELMVYSTALVLGLKKDKIKALQNYNHKNWSYSPKLLSREKQEYKINNLLKIEFPQWFNDKLYKIGRFTVDITKPNGEVPQIGDNDSGRFFRLTPNGKFMFNQEAVEKYINLEGYIKDNSLFWDENILDHSTFISAVSGLFEDDIFDSSITVEKTFIESIAKNYINVENKPKKSIQLIKNEIPELDHKNTIIHNTKFKIKNLKLIPYVDSGIFVFKTDNLYLILSITPLGSNGGGSHTHNDKLSYELWLDGKNIIKDPGTYLYTPLPQKRNEFRSINAHNVPIINNMEQNSYTYGKLFGFDCNSNSRLLSIENDFVEVILEYNNGYKQIRKISFLDKKIKIEDSSNQPFVYTKFSMYSSGYGKLEVRAFEGE